MRAAAARSSGSRLSAHARASRRLPLAQLRRELQQPREAVRALEAHAALALEVARPRPRGCSAVRLRASAARAVARERRLGQQAREAREQPVAVHRRVPVVAAVEGRRQLARRARVGVAAQHVRDLVRVLLVHAGEREAREALGEPADRRRLAVAAPRRAARRSSMRARSILALECGDERSRLPRARAPHRGSRPRDARRARGAPEARGGRRRGRAARPRRPLHRPARVRHRGPARARRGRALAHEPPGRDQGDVGLRLSPASGEGRGGDRRAGS